MTLLSARMLCVCVCVGLRVYDIIWHLVFGELWFGHGLFLVGGWMLGHFLRKDPCFFDAA